MGGQGANYWIQIVSPSIADLSLQILLLLLYGCYIFTVSSSSSSGVFPAAYKR